MIIIKDIDKANKFISDNKKLPIEKKKTIVAIDYQGDQVVIYEEGDELPSIQS